MFSLLLLAASALAADATPPEPAELVQLSPVQCFSERASFEVIDGRWRFYLDNTLLGHGDPTGSTAFRLERQGDAPATRHDRPKAPWTWTERMVLRKHDGDQVEVLAEQTLSCAHVGPDVVHVLPDPLFAGEPSPGRTRCKSRDGSVRYVTIGYVGGIAPGPDRIVNQGYLFVGDVLVGGQQVRGDHTVVDTPAALDVQVDWSGVRKLPPGAVGQLPPSKHVFSRVDGEPLQAGMPTLTVDLVCEYANYEKVP